MFYFPIDVNFELSSNNLVNRNGSCEANVFTSSLFVRADDVGLTLEMPVLSSFHLYHFNHEICIGGLQPISRDTDHNAAMHNCWWTNKRS